MIHHQEHQRNITWTFIKKSFLFIVSILLNEKKKLKYAQVKNIFINSSFISRLNGCSLSFRHQFIVA